MTLFPKASGREIWITLSLTAAYLLLSRTLLGFHTEQIYLAVIFLGFYYLSLPTRQFIAAFSIFIVFWILFDFMKAFPNYQYVPVHIKDLFDTDRSLFGIHESGGIESLNQFFLIHHYTLLDIVAGFSYLCWMPVPLGFGIYLFVKKRDRFLPFALTFLFVNLIGFAIYYLYPAAPPWYVENYGFVFHLPTPGNTAGLHRFDAYFHVSVFSALYSKSSNVFAAMPSLHAAYPLIVFYHGIRNKLGAVNIFLGLVVGGIWFAAVYSSHHYVLDVLAGIGCACLGIALFEKVLLKMSWFQRFLRAYNGQIGLNNRPKD